MVASKMVCIKVPRTYVIYTPHLANVLSTCLTVISEQRANKQSKGTSRQISYFMKMINPFYSGCRYTRIADCFKRQENPPFNLSAA